MTEYVELKCRSYYSLLDGASSPEMLVARASELGMPALGLVDRNNVYGAIAFVEAAREHGIKPILGASLTLDTGYELSLLVADEIGWSNLCWLITQAQHNAPKGKACLISKLLPGHTDGLIALSGGREGAVASALAQRKRKTALSNARDLLELFGKECFWIELQHHALRGDRQLLGELVRLSQYLGVGYVATNDVHYVSRENRRLRDVLVSIRNLLSLDEAEHLHHSNDQYFLKSKREMRESFAEYPRALTNTLLIAEQCDFHLQYGLQDLPQVNIPDGLSAADYLRQLSVEGLRRRCLASSRYIEQLDHELGVIHRAGLDNYFLIVWDVVRFARSSGIRCQGRGSAANSLVAYLLDISPVDPLKYNLVFERFLSDERRLAPDIDLDFQNDRRDEVIEYVYNKYGRDHAAMTATYITYRRRSAVRDVGRILGLPQNVLDRLSDSIDYFDDNTSDFGRLVAPETGAYLQDLSQQISGLPRHLGIHSGGMVIMREPLATRLPTEPAKKEGITVVQADKEALATGGLIKFDFLALGILAAIADALEIIETQTGKRPNLETLTYDDPAIFEMITAGDTVAIFQVESRAQSQMLPRFKPKSFKDIVIAISLIRPGPIQGDMVHPFLRRRLGEEKVTYFHELLEGCLSETLGVVLFQEDVLKVAQHMAGFTPGQGELLRRALGAKNATAAIDKFHDEFVAGALKKGVSRQIAETVFEKLKAFGSYSFPKSHAASFAVLVYQSAWLKRYFPLAFYLGILRNQPMGFWTPAIVVNDARRHGISVLGVDVNRSEAECTDEYGAIRIGFNYIKGFGESACKRVMAARKQGIFEGLADFCQRTQLPRRLVQHLILVGAFNRWGTDRRQLLWELGTVSYTQNTLDLDFDEKPIDLPAFGYLELRGIEFQLLGLSLHEHPLEIYRGQLAEQGMLNSRDLQYVPEKRIARLAGINVVHQAPPTAKGFHFVTLEDEFGFINVIFRPSVYARVRKIVRQNPLLVIEGKIEREGAVINILAHKATIISALHSGKVRARRFR